MYSLFTGETPLPVASAHSQGGFSLVAAIGGFAKRKPLGAIGAVVLLAVVLGAAAAPWISPFDPYEVHVAYIYAPPGTEIAGTGQRFWLSADQLGRDVLSRLIYGARVSLTVSLVSVGVGVTAGFFTGIVSAYLGGSVDLVVQRFVDAMMSFPPVILALAIVAVAGGSLQNVIVAVAILLMPASVRVVRSQALGVKESMYIDAARAMGASSWRIIVRHVLPNCAAPAIVFATANLGFAVVIEAGLSFLGVGLPPDVPSWGTMLSTAGQKYVEVSPSLVLFPSLAVSIVVFSFNLLGDALRDVLDPKLRGA